MVSTTRPMTWPRLQFLERSVDLQQGTGRDSTAHFASSARASTARKSWRVPTAEARMRTSPAAIMMGGKQMFSAGNPTTSRVPARPQAAEGGVVGRLCRRRHQRHVDAASLAQFPHYVAGCRHGARSPPPGRLPAQASLRRCRWRSPPRPCCGRSARRDVPGRRRRKRARRCPGRMPLCFSAR